MSSGARAGEEVEGRKVGGREGMKIMVVIWIWVKDGERSPLSPTFSWDETAVSVSDTFSADSGWMYCKKRA